MTHANPTQTPRKPHSQSMRKPHANPTQTPCAHTPHTPHGVYVPTWGGTNPLKKDANQ